MTQYISHPIQYMFSKLKTTCNVKTDDQIHDHLIYKRLQNSLEIIL